MRALTFQRVKFTMGLPLLKRAIQGQAEKTKNFVSWSLVIGEVLSIADMATGVKCEIIDWLFGGAVRSLGNPDRVAKWLQPLQEQKYTGMFAVTERGRGSKVRGIQTEATFDLSAQVRILSIVAQSLCENAEKMCIGNAMRGDCAVVFAQRIINGRSQGLHCFIVPVRDENGSLYPGVTVIDMMYKEGLHGVDNGILVFDKVQVPRENLLDRFGSVAPEGRYHSPREESERLNAVLAVLTPSSAVTLQAMGAMTLGLMIAIRYSHSPRQFGPKAKEEVRIIEHQQTVRLMPHLATALALTFVRGAGVLLDEDIFYGKELVSSRPLQALVAGLKACSTWENVSCLQDCPECTGGMGYMMENRISGLKCDTDVLVTFEGDNVVMLQVVVRELLAQYSKQSEERLLFGLLQNWTESVGDKLRTSFLASDVDSVGKLAFLLKAVNFRERVLQRGLVARIYDKNSTTSIMWRPGCSCQPPLYLPLEFHHKRHVEARMLLSASFIFAAPIKETHRFCSKRQRYLKPRLHRTGLDCDLKPRLHRTGLDCDLKSQLHKTGLDCDLKPRLHRTGLDCDHRTDLDCDYRTDLNCDHRTGLDCDLKPRLHRTGLDCDLKPRLHRTGLDCDLKSQLHRTGLDCDLKPQLHRTGLDCDLKSQLHRTGLALTETTGLALTETTGLALTVSIGLALTVTRGLALTETTGLALTETTGLALTETRGLALTETRGLALTETTGLALTETTGLALTETRGLALTETRGLALTETTGLALTETTGLALTETRGLALSETRGRALTVTRGLALTVTRGLALSETTGLALTETRGLTLTETTGLALTETRGLALTVTTGLALSLIRGLTLTETRGLALTVTTDLETEKGQPHMPVHCLLWNGPPELERGVSEVRCSPFSFILSVTLEQLSLAVKNCSDQEDQALLMKFCLLYGTKLVFQEQAWYLEHKYLTQASVRTQSQWLDLCDSVKDDALRVISALAFYHAPPQPLAGEGARSQRREPAAKL
ncbi:LOW QUALITY PROTEIN: acyl-coenzyme A oxidase-like protein [Trichechus inunguis]